MIAFLAPGQGAERVGMGRDVALHCAAAADYLIEAKGRTGVNSLHRSLSRTEVVQPFLIATALGAAAGLQQLNVVPQILAGYSVGELSAWALAEGHASHAVGLAHVRGVAMAQSASAAPGGMVACRTPPNPLPPGVCVAVESPGQVVLAGPLEAIRGLGRPIPTSGAWHTPAMAPAVSALRAALKSVPQRELRVPLISGVTGEGVDGARARECLAEGLVAPVRWSRVLKTLIGCGVTDVVLLPPGRVLAAQLRAYPPFRVHRAERWRDIEATARALS